MARRDTLNRLHLYQSCRCTSEDMELLARRVSKIETVQITFSDLSYLRNVVKWLLSTQRMPGVLELVLQLGFREELGCGVKQASAY